MRFVFFIAGAISCAAAFAIACGSSDDDNTVYGPPDAGNQSDADFCVSDIDCPPDNSNNQFACGFPIADACEARGVCVPVDPNHAKCPTPNMCGCDGTLVGTCPISASGYVRGGPTNGKTPTTSADGGAPQCSLGS
jgi:hypothetical protein